MVVVTCVVVGLVAVVVVNEVAGVLHEIGIYVVEDIEVFGPTIDVNGYNKQIYRINITRATILNEEVVP